jgi:hypothetical protein
MLLGRLIGALANGCGDAKKGREMLGRMISPGKNDHRSAVTGLRLPIGKSNVMQAVFTVLIVIQFLVVALHDLVDIPGWTHGRQVRLALGRNKVLIGTLINSLFPGLAAGFAIYYWGRPAPAFALIYWILYCGVTVAWAIVAWWIPYFRGTDEETKQLYAKMYAGTHNPRPNLLHLFFHALFLINLILAVVLCFVSA